MFHSFIYQFRISSDITNVLHYLLKLLSPHIRQHIMNLYNAHFYLILSIFFIRFFLPIYQPFETCDGNLKDSTYSYNLYLYISNILSINVVDVM